MTYLKALKLAFTGQNNAFPLVDNYMNKKLSM